MSVYGVLFYALGGLMLAATTLAVTSRSLVHAVVYLVNAFFATGLLFYLLGAPLLAAFEIIIYAGAIMVLFLFIVMLTRQDKPLAGGVSLMRWLLPGLTSLVSLAAGTALVFSGGATGVPLAPAMASPRDLGRALFSRWWLGVEIVSFLLLVALVGALYLGRAPREGAAAGKSPGDAP